MEPQLEQMARSLIDTAEHDVGVAVGDDQQAQEVRWRR
jgi:hypothetical protein